MFRITLSPAFSALCPDFIGAIVTAKVKNSPTSALLHSEISDAAASLRTDFTTESIKTRPGIAATRMAYRSLGKDPSRYRPACEQLARRILQGKELYSIDSLVDLVNLVSLLSGYSTAALDAEHIANEDILLGVGAANEPYEAIGRGLLNIENLPVYRDSTGAFATPTSDSTRTQVTTSTTHIAVLINGYDGNETEVRKAAEKTIDLLLRFAEAKACEYHLYRNL